MLNILKNLSRRIYLDYASLTPIDPRVLNVIDEYSSQKYANPSSWYKEGVAANKALFEARKNVADFIHAHRDEIIFTSGGTEANNLALQGVVAAYMENNLQDGRFAGLKPHIIVSAIEHSSIMETADALVDNGCEVTKVPVDRYGVIDLVEFKKSIKPNTILISIMTVNNEIGVIQPIHEIAKIIRQARTKLTVGVTNDDARSCYPLFHTDAAQAGLYQDLNVDQLGVDLLSLDGGKVYGPRGMGALYVRRKIFIGNISVDNVSKTLIKPIFFGGGQEKGLRSGTENLPAIVGFAKALVIAQNNRENETMRLVELNRFFVDGLSSIRKNITINSLIQNSSEYEQSISPHILNISIPAIDNEFFVMQLDAAGIICSTKSSCLRDQDESYVLKAIGADSKTSVRFSFGRWTKKGDIKKTLKVIRHLLA